MHDRGHVQHSIFSTDSYRKPLVKSWLCRVYISDSEAGDTPHCRSRDQSSDESTRAQRDFESSDFESSGFVMKPLREQLLELSFKEQMTFIRSPRVAEKSLAATKTRPTSTDARTVRRASCSTTQSSDASRWPASVRPQATQDTLDIALRGQYSSRKPKPRSSSGIDDTIWSGAIDTAKARVEEKFSICSLDEHYIGMCALGKSLLVQELTKEAQGLYDFRASKQIQRANRRAKGSSN